MPSARASIGLWKWHALPSTTMAPSVAGKFPAISFTMVDLPAPLSPISPTTSPASIEKLTSVSARMAPKLFEMLRTSSKATRSLRRAGGGSIWPLSHRPVVQLILHTPQPHNTYFSILVGGPAETFISILSADARVCLSALASDRLRAPFPVAVAHRRRPRYFGRN